jgi:zinc protease
VVGTEADSRGPAGAAGACLVERYGATGPGLAGYEEYGLLKPDWAQIADWRRRSFVASNAVLCIAGDIPAGLRIPLPEGARPEMEPLRPCELDLPAYLVAGRGGVGISLIADAGLASGAALAILQSRLTQQLRHQRSLSYQVTSASECLDPRLRHAWIAADALPDEVPMAAHVALTVLEELAADCATEQELADYVQQMRRACEALDTPWQLLLSQARSCLLRGKIRDQAGMLRRAAALTSRDIAAAMTDLRRQMIVVTPQVLPAVQGRMPRLRAMPVATVTGIRYPAQGASGSLIIGADGVSLQGEPDLLATVRFDDLAALLRWNDGTQMLVGNDGFRIQLAAGDWNGADQALSDLPGLVAAVQIVTIDGAGPPGRHQVSSPPPEPVRSATAPSRSRWRSASARLAVFWLLMAAWLLLASMALADKLINPPLFAVLVVVTLGTNGRHAARAFRRRQPGRRGRSGRTS